MDGKLDKITTPTVGHIVVAAANGTVESSLDPATLATAANLATVADRVPVPPSSLADGQYKLVVTVNSGVLTYTWEVV
jgi:hypothetical protein